jgi:hypothetical protein
MVSAVAFRQFQTLGKAGDQPAEGLQAVGHALWLAGAAGGEEDEAGRAVIGRGQIDCRPFRLTQELEARARAQITTIGDQAKRQLAGLLTGGDVCCPLGMGEEDRSTAQAQGMIHLRRHIAVVEGGGHQPGLHAGQVVDHQGGPVGHQRGDPVPRFEAEAQQVAGQAGAGLLQLAPRPARFRRNQCQVVRFGRKPGAQDLGQVDGGVQKWSR